MSKELAVSFGRMLEQLVVVSRAREDTSVEVEGKVCKGITQVCLVCDDEACFIIVLCRSFEVFQLECS